ncbi:MAG: nickel pincer cofactor biosynthesis protein LarC [Chloroflexota bacterium]|nr:MAG: nickel pincer cofactor biosynthesis protein LarC [Chloroflexota bacterium]
MTVLYCDCFSGISGDMFLGALLDAGLPPDYLADHLKRLHLPEFTDVTVERVHRGSLAAALLKLDIHEHDGDTNHEASDHHRRLNDIQVLIEAGDLPDTVKQTSLKIFQKLAEAEAKVHGCAVEEVHFHEVGAVDSILDIVGSAVGLHYFNIHAVYASALPLGTGQVRTQHGLLPLPAPATLELLRSAQAPVVSSPAKFELVTPTGAAILAALATFIQPNLRLQRVGVGAGQRNLEWPNVLRVLIGEEDSSAGNHLEVETNIDDMNPQILGHVMAKLFQAGALDVYFTPIFMKKNRPAAKLSVIVQQEDESKICDLILRETSTLGLRVTRVWRHEAEREMRNISTCYGEVPVKVKFMDGHVVQATPEFDACVRLAESAGVPVQRILQEAAAASRAIIKD